VEPDMRKVRRAVHKIGEDIFPYLFPVKYADIHAQSEYKRQDKIRILEQWQQLYEEIEKENQCVSLKTMAVTGSDLIAAGMKPGKEVGDLLNILLDMVLENPENNTKDFLMQEVKMRLGS